MVVEKLGDFVESDAAPAIGVIAGAGFSSAIAGYVVDQMKWTGTDKAAWASVGLKVLAGLGLYTYSNRLTDKSSMQYVLARGAALGSLVGIGITLWNRFAPFQLQVRPDSALLNVNPSAVGRRQMSERPRPVRVASGSAPQASQGGKGLKVSAIGSKR